MSKIIIGTAATTVGSVAPRDGQDSRRGRPTSAAHVSAVLAVVASLTMALTFWWPGVLRGPPAMNGSARGTALVIMVVAVPVMIMSLRPALAGSPRAAVVWTGCLVYLVYNAVMLLFATPFNRLFLLYVATLSLSLVALIGLLVSVRPLPASPPGRGRRVLAVYVGVVATMNTAAWLRTVIPATLADDAAPYFRGTGLVTNVTYVQDLSVWLPAAFVSALWLWRGHPWGSITAGALLVFWVIEAVGVATDQWFGSRADPDSSVVSSGAVLPFTVLAAIGLVPVLCHLRGLPRSQRPLATGPLRETRPPVRPAAPTGQGSGKGRP